MHRRGNRKIIVAVAPVGREIEQPSKNPLAPEDIANEVIDCTRAGAALVHLHVRDRRGEQTGDLKDYTETLNLIRKSSDIIIQGSTGGLTSLSLEERCVALNEPTTEVASLNMGSVNFGDDVYINRLPDIRFWAQRMMEHGIVPELEIFDAGMLAVVEQMKAEGVLNPPFYQGLVLGARWGVPADPKSLFFLTTMMTEQSPWGVIQDGMKDLSLMATAIGLGASFIRVGFEDSVYSAPGRVAETNAELVERLVSLIRQMGLEIATPSEARQMLGIAPLKR